MSSSDFVLVVKLTEVEDIATELSRKMPNRTHKYNIQTNYYSSIWSTISGKLMLGNAHEE
ncbi:hypothetical protein IMCC3135_31230 [Granulosicoccus antarcticus IMCC3135]|uniref:Uncharacterized protein n=1 Tax=Granulosicoccus antarcticus IMCC3135 TaxID=1192854 RepID=A0A2Z2P8T3_9GAMM|nr:hypothetical protein IMCC3135_31230 [Granulosicoccus antarcticus IMCC3135]